MFQTDDFEDMLPDDTISVIDRVFDSLNESEHPSQNTFNSELINSSTDNPSNVSSPNKSEEDIHDGFVKKRTCPETDNPKRKKRKFPGPAGLLPENNKQDNTLNSSHIIHSQSINLSQNQFLSSIFEEGPWNVMLDEMKMYGYMSSKYSIKSVKAQANNHKMIGQRVPFLVGIVHNVDRSLQDPCVVLKDSTDEINGSVHRDVWETYGPFLVPQYSAMFLRNVSILTTGTATKKNYLNITLNNIVIVCCDEKNSYTTKDQRLSMKSDIINNRYKLIKVKWNSTEIIVLRSNYTNDSLSSSFSDNSNFLSSHDSIQEELIAETLDGINPDEFADDFN